MMGTASPVMWVWPPRDGICVLVTPPGSLSGSGVELLLLWLIHPIPPSDPLDPDRSPDPDKPCGEPWTARCKAPAELLFKNARIGGASEASGASATSAKRTPARRSPPKIPPDVKRQP